MKLILVTSVYLITTDILGPSNAPWAISQFGFVGGVMMYTFMGIMAFYAGWQIWRMFLKLDSDRYPMVRIFLCLVPLERRSRLREHVLRLLLLIFRKIYSANGLTREPLVTWVSESTVFILVTA